MSEVLKSCGIDSHHKQFRPFLQKLFKVCSSQWLQQLGSNIKTSTSEAMRTLVMKHKNTVLKLKTTSPKTNTINKDNNATLKRKSVADVKKVLFTDNTPKSDFKFEKFGSDLKSKESPPKDVVVTKGLDDLTVFLDIKKFNSQNSEDQMSTSVSTTSGYCSNLDIDSLDSETISAG